jgi:hypothetical protein
MVHASVAVLDFIHRRLRCRVASVGILVWTRSQRALAMKPSSFPRSFRKWRLAGFLFVAILSWTFFHAKINHALSLRLFLDSINPREELFEELAKQSNDPLCAKYHHQNRCTFCEYQARQNELRQAQQSSGKSDSEHLLQVTDLKTGL